MHPNDVAEFGYFQPRVLPTGELAALNKFMFTFGLLTGIDQVGYRCRWCYESLQAAHIALRDWDGRGDPPGPWIKQKGKNEAGEVVDRSNPAHCVHRVLHSRGVPGDLEIYCADCGLIHRAAADFSHSAGPKHEWRVPRPRTDQNARMDKDRHRDSRACPLSHGVAWRSDTCQLRRWWLPS